MHLLRQVELRSYIRNLKWKKALGIICFLAQNGLNLITLKLTHFHVLAACLKMGCHFSFFQHLTLLIQHYISNTTTLATQIPIRSCNKENIFSMASERCQRANTHTNAQLPTLHSSDTLLHPHPGTLAKHNWDRSSYLSQIFVFHDGIGRCRFNVHKYQKKGESKSLPSINSSSRVQIKKAKVHSTTILPLKKVTQQTPTRLILPCKQYNRWPISPLHINSNWMEHLGSMN